MALRSKPLEAELAVNARASSLSRSAIHPTRLYPGRAVPREAVIGLLVEGRRGPRQPDPDPVGLLQRLDAAQERVRRMNVAHREQSVAALLDRLTPLDPRRPARDLLEHLLNGPRVLPVGVPRGSRR